MGIFEKAFEKAAKGFGDTRDDELYDATDDLLDLTEHSGEETVELPPAETADSLRVEGPGREVKLDLNGLIESGLVDPRSKQVNHTTEEFRRIKRPLLMHVMGKGATVVANANMIMVTSALAGEGKTFTAINLAMSIAMEMDRTVLLVDADVAKPDVAQRLGVEAEKGLIDVLLDEELTLPDVLLRTDIPKLTLLPSGGKHVHSTELLASERMRQLTMEVSTRYPDRIVIFDSPPLLLTSESRVLAGLMGQVVLVVEEATTSQHAVKEAMALLESNEIVGVVMNKGRRGRSRDAYGGYGYGYYPYGSDKATTK